MTAFLQDDLEAAAEHGRAALLAFRAAGIARDVMNTLSTVSYILTVLGSYEEAERLAQEGLDKDTEARQSATGALEENLGLARLKRGFLSEAITLFTRSCENFTRMGRTQHIASSLTYLALARLDGGEVDEARACVHRALAHCAEGSRAEAFALAVDAKIDLRRADAASALHSAERALAVVRKDGALEHQALIRATHAESLIACERLDEARAAIVEASVWLDTMLAKIRDPGLRQSFATNVAENARILELTRTWLSS